MRPYIRWGLFIVFPLLVGALILFLYTKVPNTLILKDKYPVVSYEKSPQNETIVNIEFVEERPRYWVSLKSVPRWVRGAVITSEDWAFYEHQGFDLAQIQKALEDSMKSGDRLRGASTLSQQLVKNLFLGHERTWARKLKEGYLTFDLEKNFSKDEILEFYLNIVEWGVGVVGVEQAARKYFQKPASEILPHEAAFLAFLLPNPLRYSASFRDRKLTDFAAQQLERNLQRMKQAHYITEDELDFYLRQRLSFDQRIEDSGLSDDGLSDSSELLEDELKKVEEAIDELLIDEGSIE